VRLTVDSRSDVRRLWNGIAFEFTREDVSACSQESPITHKSGESPGFRAKACRISAKRAVRHVDARTATTNHDVNMKFDKSRTDLRTPGCNPTSGCELPTPYPAMLDGLFACRYGIFIGAGTEMLAALHECAH